MADHKPAPAVASADAPKAQSSYKIVDVRASDVTLEMEDGRVFVATVKDGIKLDDLKRGQMVAITNHGFDKGDAPTEAQVVRVLPKD